VSARDGDDRDPTVLTADTSAGGEPSYLRRTTPEDIVMTALVSTRTNAGSIVYWVSTTVVTAELAVGGMWDGLRVSQVREVVERLGYPSYFLLILGVWKLLGAVALLSPRLPRLKEWAYAGVVFVDTGAIVSHLWTGYGDGEVVILTILLALTAASWTLRPPTRRLCSGEQGSGQPVECASVR
jgi:uncharacterized membrane protein YphA (DoxX/SURF4 family)